jgi:CheY-like chemotaxis protein
MTPISTLRILLIEDDQTRIEIFKAWLPKDIRMVVATCAGKALGILKRDRGHVYSGILLDHDLQEQTLTAIDRHLSGTDIVKAIDSNIAKGTPVLVHSMNLSKATWMVEALEGCGYFVTRIPMSVLKMKDFIDWLDEVRDTWELRNDLYK